MNTNETRRCSRCGIKPRPNAQECHVCGKSFVPRPNIAVPPRITPPPIIAPLPPHVQAIPPKMEANRSAPPLAASPSSQTNPYTFPPPLQKAPPRRPILPTLLGGIVFVVALGLVVCLVVAQPKSSPKKTRTASGKNRSSAPVALPTAAPVNSAPVRPPEMTSPLTLPAAPVNRREQEVVAAYLTWLQGFVQARNKFVDQANTEMHQQEQEIDRVLSVRGVPSILPMQQMRMAQLNWFTELIANYDTSTPPEACKRLHVNYRAILVMDQETVQQELRDLRIVDPHQPPGAPLPGMPDVERSNEQGMLAYSRQAREERHKNREVAVNQCMEDTKAIWRAYPSLPANLFDFDGLFTIIRNYR